MSEKGIIKIQTQDGVEEIPVFETDDVNNSAWRVQTETGVGAVRLVDPGEADLPQIRVQTSEGVKSVATSLTLQTSDGYPVLQALDRESQIEAQLEDDE